MAADPLEDDSEPGRRSLFERALDALPDGILLIDSSRAVAYCNPAFADHWRIPDSIVQSRDEIRMLELARDQVLDPVAFVREVERITPTAEPSEDEVRLKDGRVLSRRSVPFADGGAFAARLWIFTDVTEARSASVDDLSGLPNRRAYASQFPAFVKAQDDGILRSVGIVDIDNFKAYNDHYGHAAGDLVLRRIGELLRVEAARADDLAFRIGGEEFLIAARTARGHDPRAVFEALRAGVSAMNLAHAGNAPHGTVTISIGLSSFHGPGCAAALFDEADAALYRAKRGGRNRVESAGPPAGA